MQVLDAHARFNTRCRTFCNTTHWCSQKENTPLYSIYQPAAVWCTGWPGLGMATASCEKLRKHWKFNAQGEVRREDVPVWPRKACWQGEGVQQGDKWSGGGVGTCSYSLAVHQCIILPKSTSECAHFFFFFLNNAYHFHLSRIVALRVMILQAWWGFENYSKASIVWEKHRLEINVNLWRRFK